VHAATAILETEDFLPAVGQGTIAIETRAADARVRDLVAAIDHADTSTALTAERAFLAVLDGSCRTPIAGHATVAAQALQFRGLILRPDGSEAHETACGGSRADAAAIGAEAGRELKRLAPADFFTPR
jgi:hydroxymethylbilane synthase